MILRPTNGGHGIILPNEEWRTIEDTNDSVLSIVKSNPISVIIGRWLIHFLTIKWVSWWPIHYPTKWTELGVWIWDKCWTKANEWMNEWNIMHWEPFIYAHATVFKGHELSIINLHSIWLLYPCWYWLYLILSKVSHYPDEYLVRNHVCSRDTCMSCTNRSSA